MRTIMVADELRNRARRPRAVSGLTVAIGFGFAIPRFGEPDRGRPASAI